MSSSRSALRPFDMLPAAVLAVLLASCGAAPEEEARSADPPEQGVEAPASAPPPLPGDATVGGDGSEIVLTPLSAAEIEEAALAGELGCSFLVEEGPPLLLAKGYGASGEPGRGVVKVGSYVEVVAAPGGYDAMLEGVTFTGAGKTLRITPTGPATAGGESPPRPATLTYDRADGARRDFDGQWQCGP